MSSSNININDFFKLPICYNSSKIELNDTIITDLELIKTIDDKDDNDNDNDNDDKNKDVTDSEDEETCTSLKCCSLLGNCFTEEPKKNKDKNKETHELYASISNKSMYNYAFKPTSVFGKQVLEQIPKYYSTDIDFLKDSQNLLKTYNPIPEKHNYEDILSIWSDIKSDTGFKEKYQYVEIEMFNKFNHSDIFLQFMSMYNLSSPVISLLAPVFLLIVPFFIIHLKGMQISISHYIEILKEIAANHAIGRLFTNFNQVESQQKIYLLVSAGFYIFSIYQNILSCFRFHQNMIKMHSYLNNVSKYIDYTCESMNNLLSYTKTLNTYSNFSQAIQTNREILTEYNIQLKCINPYKLSLYTIGGLGHVLKCFYQLFDNTQYNDAFMYSFGYNGYIDNIEGLIDNIREKYLQFSSFTEKISKKCKIKNSYYPALMHNKPVKNTCNLKNMIITGPNASGKTTTLKSVLINVIITQQFGCGFYDKACLKPYDFIHCYLNIPDTSGRDSLFQAECRRCKEILDAIATNESSKTHLCVFDELYSGTNPDEAVMSSLAFMRYLIKSKNITCILTTHFIKVCQKFDKEKTKLITNHHMDTEPISKDGKSSDFKYTYKLKKGISEIKGGIKVLRDMNYPAEILNDSFTE